MKAMNATIVLASALALAACDSGGGDKSGGKADGTAKADGTGEAASAEAIPVEEDFEEEAAAEITQDNLDDQVSALEKEIEGG